MTALALYDAMVCAIAECERVDEVKDMRDRAAALEAYSRQARNLDAERQACNVRLRAERRVGELLKELARADEAKGGAKVAAKRWDAASNDATPHERSPYAQALSDAGLTRQTAHRYQALANVPAETFEAALASPRKATTNGILAQSKAAAPRAEVDPDALWVWGRLRDFETDRVLDRHAPHLLDTMTDAMRADVRRLAPLVADFLAAMGDAA